MTHTFISLFTAAFLLGAGHTCLAQTASTVPNLTTADIAPANAAPRTVRVKGIVQGPKGPLPGVVLQVNGSKTMSVSGADGKFELEVPGPATVVYVTCSYAGLADETVKLPTNAPNTVIRMLKPVPRTVAEPVLESGWW